MKIRNSLLMASAVSLLIGCGGADKPSYRVKYIEEKDQSGQLLTTATYSYNNSGQLINRESTSSSVSYWNYVVTYKYKEDGQLSETLQSPYEGGPTDFRTTYEFNQAGQLVNSFHDYQADGSINNTLSYEYNINGQLIKRNDKDSRGVTYNSYLYFYDANGYINKTEREISGTEKTLYTNTLNELGQLIVLEADSNGDGIADTTRYYTYEQGPCVATQPNSVLHHCGQ